MALLGEDPSTKSSKDLQLHEQLVSRWSYVIKKGLKKENKRSLLGKYSRSGNCDLEPLLLNPELDATLNESSKKRDGYFTEYQRSVGSAIAAVGATISLCLNDSQGSIDRHMLLESLGDAGSLLTDLHHNLTVSRRYLILPNMDKKVRELLVKSETDKWLFGDNLSEKLKSATAAERLGLVLRTQPAAQKKALVSRVSGNSKGPSVRGNYRAAARPRSSNYPLTQRARQSFAPKTGARSFPPKNPE